MRIIKLCVKYLTETKYERISENISFTLNKLDIIIVLQ